MSEYEKDIIRTSSQHVSDVISINKELTEKTLRMRCQSYLAHVKSQLLTQTVYEISSSKKVLKKLNKDLLDINVKLKSQQEIIAEQKEEWERSFNALSSQVCILDMSGTILRANKAMRDCFEATHGNIIGMDYRLIYYGTATDDPRCPCTAVLSGTSDKVSVETCFPTMDGWYQVSFYSLHDSSGKQCGAVSAVEDITERKKMEEELVKMQKLKSVGILAGGIAHDFNNSLQGILSMIALAETCANPDDEIYTRLEEAKKVVLQSKNLTQQLLTFSRGGDPVKNTISIPEVISDSADLALSRSNVTCELDLPDDLWSVEADKGQISQVIGNLTKNADQAMPGGGTIRIEAENINVNKEITLPLTAGEYVKITIADDGNGISQEHLPKIFDPYFTTGGDDRGLGLSIVYSIVNKHDGFVTAESKVGIGTTFYIYLPASHKEITARTVLKSTKGKAPIKGKGRVLLMDDDDVIRRIVAELLKNLKYEVETAEDGAVAIGLYKESIESDKLFDAVIMDLTIPNGMGGKETIEKLLEIDPDVKAIVSSGFSDDPVMSDFRKYGFNDALVKPFQISDLNEKLQSMIMGMS